MIDESRALMIEDGEDWLRLQLIQQEYLLIIYVYNSQVQGERRNKKQKIDP